MSPKSTNEWTELSPRTPLRVKKVLYSTKRKESMAMMAVSPPDVFFFFTMNMRWAAATSVIQGTSEAFSTGSQAQKPPKLSAS